VRFFLQLELDSGRVGEMKDQPETRPVAGCLVLAIAFVVCVAMAVTGCICFVNWLVSALFK
jgi:hypothetical protein